MTAAGVVTRFQKLYKEQSTRYFDTDWQVEAMNDSIEEIASEIDNLHPSFLSSKAATLSYITAQQEYQLPTDFLKIEGVEVTDLGGPPYIALTEIDFEQRNVAIIGPSAPQFLGGGQGEPVCYYIRELKSGETLIGSNTVITTDRQIMGFVPIPSRTATNNVRIFYDPIRANITAIDTTVPNLPGDFHSLIARRMCALAAIEDGLPTIGKYATLYNDLLVRRLQMAITGRGEGQEYVEIDDAW